MTITQIQVCKHKSSVYFWLILYPLSKQIRPQIYAPERRKSSVNFANVIRLHHHIDRYIPSTVGTDKPRPVWPPNLENLPSMAYNRPASFSASSKAPSLFQSRTCTTRIEYDSKEIQSEMVLPEHISALKKKKSFSCSPINNSTWTFEPNSSSHPDVAWLKPMQNKQKINDHNVTVPVWWLKCFSIFSMMFSSQSVQIRLKTAPAT